MTLKQLEALCAVAQLGGHQRAAARLHTTQSAVSKRVQELEASLGAELFDRSHRRARLTARGEEVRRLAEEMLSLRARLVELGGREEPAPRRFRLGVTELTAMTWLPRLVQELRAAHPEVLVEPEIAPGAVLRQALLAGELDLAVAPGPLEHRDAATVPLGEVENAWMCSPAIAPARRVLPLAEIGRFTLLVQGGKSAVGALVDRWLRANAVRVERRVTTDNLVALAGLTLSGLGVSYMPRAYFGGLVRAGLLAVIRTTPALPAFSYVAAYRRDRPSAFAARVANACRTVCDYTTPYGERGRPPPRRPVTGG